MMIILYTWLHLRPISQTTISQRIRCIMNIIETRIKRVETTKYWFGELRKDVRYFPEVKVKGFIFTKQLNFVVMNSEHYEYYNALMSALLNSSMSLQEYNILEDYERYTGKELDTTSEDSCREFLDYLLSNVDTSGTVKVEYLKHPKED